MYDIHFFVWNGHHHHLYSSKPDLMTFSLSLSLNKSSFNLLGYKWRRFVGLCQSANSCRGHGQWYKGIFIEPTQKSLMSLHLYNVSPISYYFYCVYQANFIPLPSYLANITAMDGQHSPQLLQLYLHHHFWLELWVVSP